MNIGLELKKLRKAAKITQNEFAKRADLGLRFVRELEQGKPTIRLDKLLVALNFFGYSIDLVKTNRHLIFNFKFPYPKKFTKELKEKIRNKFHFTCLECHKVKRPSDRFDIHHVDYNKENCSEDNLVLLCDQCHGRTRKNKSYWEAHLKEMMSFYARNSI